MYDRSGRGARVHFKNAGGALNNLGFTARQATSSPHFDKGRSCLVDLISKIDNVDRLMG